MSTRDDLEAVRLLAFHDVLRRDAEYERRRIARKYSERFNTPLHIVEELDWETVHQHYWESEYERLRDSDNPADLQLEARLLVRTPEEALALDRKTWAHQSAFVADADDYAARVAKEEAAKAAAEPDPVKATMAGLEKVAEAVRQLRTLDLEDDPLGGNLGDG